MGELVAGWQQPASLVWLLGCESNATQAQLADFAMYGDALGPDKVTQPAAVPWEGRMGSASCCALGMREQ